MMKKSNDVSDIPPSQKIPVVNDPQMFVPPNTREMASDSHNRSPIVEVPKREDLPQVSDLQKRNANYAQQQHPFSWEFLLPTYWGILLFVAVMRLLILLPLRMQFKLGKALGGIIFSLAKRRRQDTLVNLRLAFPEKDDSERLEMAKMVFYNAGVGVFESLCAWFRPNVFTRQVTISGLQHVIKARQATNAVLILGAHYTMLDLGGRLASMFIPVDIVYRPQNNKLLDWIIYNARTRIFNDQISHHDMRHLTKNLKAGDIIWYTPDQDFGLKQGVMANFFGVPAATVTAQRRLAMIGKKQNDQHAPTAVVMIHFYRETPIEMPKGRRPHYHIQFSPVLDNYPSDNEHTDAQRVNQMLENYIRIDPTQYMWFHRRYKTQADGKHKLYQ